MCRITLTHRLVLAVGLLISALIAWDIVTNLRASAQATAIAWEYRIVTGWDENQMTRLGADGWELVAVDASRGDVNRAFFKRTTALGNAQQLILEVVV
jgi:hypothetical protein